MFGQTAASSPFGTQPAGTPFGAPAPAPAFGASAPAPAFGAPAPAPGGFGGFGSPAPAPSGFGGFGAAPTPAAPAPAFGGFGSSTPATPFGAPAPAPSGGMFGAPAPAPSGGMFGAAPTPAPTAFGSTATTTTGGFGGFGAPAPAPSAFGAPAPAPAPAFGAPAATFGAPAPAFGAPAAASTGGLFGAPTPAPTAFNKAAPAPAFGAPAPAPGGLFGTPVPAPAPAGGLFGAAPAMGGQQGTLAVPFQPKSVKDNNTSVVFQSITAMDRYQDKSFEELRMEDYLAGNKGSQGRNPGVAAPTAFGAIAPSTGGVFGAPAPAPAGGLFGAPAPAPTGGLFGAPAPAPTAFGSPAPAPAFGAPAPAAGGFGFGATPAPAPGGLFGAAPAPAPATGGLFGAAPTPAPATGGLFGAPAPAPATGGLFGSPAPAPATGGLFGAPAPAPATGGLFGSPAAATAPGGLFGAPTPAPATGGLFGATAAPGPATGGLFGAPQAPAPATGGLFGAPAPAPATGGLFGSPAPAPATGGLFGAPAPATGGLFGSTPAPAPGGLFGSTPAPAPATGGFFGATAAPAPGGLFGSTAAPAAPVGYAAPVAGGTTILVPPAAETLLAQQMAAMENHNKELAVLEAWRGGSTPKRSSSDGSTGSIVPTSVFERDAQKVRFRGLGSGAASMNGGSAALVSSYQAAPRSAAKIRPRGFGPSRPSLGNLERGSKGVLSPSAFLGSATKQLIVRPDALTPKPKTRLLLSDDATSERKDNGKETPSNLIRGRNLENGEAATNAGRGNENGGTLLFENGDIGFTSPEAVQERLTPLSKSTRGVSSVEKERRATPSDTSYDFYKSVIGSPSESAVEKANGVLSPAKESKNNQVPKLTKDGYLMTPSIEELSEMSEADLAAVPRFVIERIGYGSVAWDGAVDVRGVDLDSVITIERKAVEVYHREEEAGLKPSVGIKLNRPAVITMLDVFPKQGQDATDEQKERFEKRITKQTKLMDATLILYDVDLGVWKIHVEHFSRYALDDDSEDEDETEDEVQIIEAPESVPCPEQKLDFESGVRGGRTLASNQVSWASVGGLTRIQVPDNDEDMEDENNLIVTDNRPQSPMDAAEAAYAEIAQMQTSEMLFDEDQQESKSCYADEGGAPIGYLDSFIAPPPSSTISNVSICAQIARRCGVKKATSSATDFGMRMGRSFRVGWRPDGTFVYPADFKESRSHGTKIVVQSKPELTSDVSTVDKNLLCVHLKHSVDISGDKEVPIFSLPQNSDVSPSEVLNEIIQSYDKNSSKASGSNKYALDITSQAFSLVSILFGKSDAVNSAADIRQKDRAVVSWLQRACAAGVEQDITSEMSRQNYCGAIFAALSGNDFSRASYIARSNGYDMLALMISNSVGESLAKQMMAWNDSGALAHFPAELLRIYQLLIRNLDVEEDLYKQSDEVQGYTLDWKRRLLMLFQSMENVPFDGTGSTISKVMEKYENDVADGVAPPASVWYANAKLAPSDNNQSCTLFRLLKVFFNEENNEDKVPLSSVISPSGYTADPFDVSKSFHFAAILSALSVCKELTEAEEHRLLESYASQLIRGKQWEWAVYITLCSLSGERCLKRNVAERKKIAAFEIVQKHYRPSDDDEAQIRRSFLENKVGIPASWFESALATRAIQMFDVQAFVSHSTISSYDNAINIYEEAILPDILFSGDKDRCRDIIDVLDAMEDGKPDISTLRGTVYAYLQLWKGVSKFASAEVGQNDNAESKYESLVKMGHSIQRCLQNLVEGEVATKWKLFNGLPLVPENITLTELSSAVSMVLSHLDDLREGHLMSQGNSHALTLKDISHQAFVPSNDDLLFSQLGSKSFLRGKHRMVERSTDVSVGVPYCPQRYGL